MTEAKISRVLVASLHQAIGDIVPARLEFYEYWLNTTGLREGRIGLAPFTAVLGFLRQEDRYPDIAERAGCYAAEWTVAAWPRFLKTALRWLPGWLRARVALGLATRLVRHTNAARRPRVACHRATAIIEIDESLFCAVRRLSPAPLCGFYAAAVRRLLDLAEVPAEVQVAACRALGAATCRILVVRQR